MTGSLRSGNACFIPCGFYYVVYDILLRTKSYSQHIDEEPFDTVHVIQSVDRQNKDTAVRSLKLLFKKMLKGVEARVT